MQPKQQTGSGSKRKRDPIGRSTDDAAPAAPSSPPQSEKKGSGIGSVIALWGPLLVVGVVIWLYGGQDRDNGAVQDQPASASSKASQANAPQPPASQRANDEGSAVAEDTVARQVAKADSSSPPASSAITSDNRRAEGTGYKKTPAKGALDSNNQGGYSAPEPDASNPHRRARTTPELAKTAAPEASQSEPAAQTADTARPSATAVTPAQLASSTPATKDPAREQNRAKAQDTHAVAASPTANEISPPQEPSAMASPHVQEEKMPRRVDVSGNQGTGEVSRAEHTDNSVGPGAKSPKAAAPDKHGPAQTASPEPSIYYYPPQAPAYYFRPPMWTSYSARSPRATANPHLPPCSYGVTNSSRMGQPCVGPHALTPYPSVWKRPRPYAQRFPSYW